MRCPFCAHEVSQVKDSRPTEDGAAILTGLSSLLWDVEDSRIEVGGDEEDVHSWIEKRLFERIGELAESTNGLVERDGRGLTNDAREAVANLRRTSETAQNSVRNLDAAISDERPGLQALSKQTIPEVGLLVSDLRDTASALSDVSQRLDQGGVTAILGAPKLPDYKAPKK